MKSGHLIIKAKNGEIIRKNKSIKFILKKFFEYEDGALTTMTTALFIQISVSRILCSAAYMSRARKRKIITASAFEIEKLSIEVFWIVYHTTKQLGRLTSIPRTYRLRQRFYQFYVFCCCEP